MTPHLLTATAVAAVTATTILSGQVAEPSQDGFQRWFVQLESPPTIEGTSERRLQDEEGRFHSEAVRAGIVYRETRHFRHVWNGVTLEAAPSGVDALRALPGVRAVFPVMRADRTQDESGGEHGAQMATALAITGADVAQQDLGLSGRHVRVAVIDSGIDYDHPDLGGCFGAGCRVRTGWDFVGDAFNPDRTSPAFNPIATPDPFPDDCDGHGTHVAGIIGANGVIRGVAPQVTFHAYRVFGCDGPTTTDILLAALEQAYADGAQVINASIGAPYQWPDYPTAQATDRLVRRGVVVVSTVGNEGANGLYAAAAPGIGRRTIGVASFDNAFRSLASFRVSPDGRAIAYLPADGSIAIPISGSAPLVRSGAVTATADACAPFPAGTFAGRIALVRRGTCSFVTKAANAQAAGAIAMVVYNSAPDRITIGVTGGTPITMPVVSISGEDGVLLHARTTSPVTLTWTSDAVQEALPTGGRVSAFSSFGPAPDLSLKPDLGAPGGAIRSTLPLERGSFGTISGTSMAAPYVAGAVALLLEARPGISPAEVLRRLQNTAVPQHASADPASGLDMVHRQGAGQISVAAAILTDTVVAPRRLLIGELADGEVRTVALHVIGKRRVVGKRQRDHKHEDAPMVYRVRHEPALSTGVSTYVPTPLAAAAAVTFKQQTVAAGQVLWLQVVPPADAAARLFGGYITLTPDDGGPTLRVPYLGYHGDYQAITALTPTTANFPWLAKAVGTNLVRQPGGATYTLSAGDSPILLFHLEHQVRALRVDVRDAATGASLGWAMTQDFVGRNSTATAFFSFSWDGTTTARRGATPIPVPNGSYRLEISVLKALGNRQDPAHTERWTTPTVVIARPAQP
ncbi:MAG: S8 family serine peptidase [Vicinamibacterales bacterium]